MGRSAARFDFAKLEALNAHYIRSSDDQDLFDRAIHILPEIEGGDRIAAALARGASPRFRAAIPSLKERSKTLVELIKGADYVLALKDNQATLHDNVKLFFQDYLNSTCNPGACDFYQSTELWDYSLVDPDNRRPVDFGKRTAVLEEIIRESESASAEAYFRRLWERI